MKHQNSKQNRLQFLHIMMLLVSFIFVLFVGRLAYIMLGGEVDGVDLRASAQQQYGRSSIQLAKRGTIYDVGGNAIATDATSYNLYAVLTSAWADEGAEPIHVPDDQKEHTAEVLSKHIDMSKEDILKQLNTENATQIEFGQAGKNLSYAKMQEIQNENLQGIHFDPQPSRLYPSGIFASHVIGYAQFQEAENPLDSRLVGQLGLEKSLDSHLAGKNAIKDYQAGHDQVAVNDANSDDNEAANSEAKDGLDVYTTIDTRLQTYLEGLMSNIYDNYHPESMTAMLVEPSTGNVLAASQRPTFNMQTRKGIEDMWTNLLVGEAFEPGSVIKVLTIAAAIEEGVFDPDATYQSGSIIVDGIRISDWNKVGWGTITQLEGLSQSSNVLVVKLVQAMGYDTWHKYMVEFGLTQKPNSGFSDEIAGSMNYDEELQKANTAFGQGIQVTPWALMQAYTAVGNGGKMMKLHVIDRLEKEDGSIEVVKPEVISSPISEETAQKTLKALESIVYAPTGTGKIYDVEGTRLAVKTGTAEIFDEKACRYLSGESNYLHSVVGFAPSDHPQYILYLTLKKPSPSAGKLAQVQLSEIFVPFMKRAMEYGKLDQSDQAHLTAVPNVVNSSIQSGQQTMQGNGFVNVEVIGDGDKVIEQFPQAGTRRSLDNRVYLLTNGQVEMPNFLGLEKTEAITLARLLGINLKVNGEGKVISQNIEPGRPISDGQGLTVELQ